MPPSALGALVRVLDAASALDSDAVRLEIHRAQSVYCPATDEETEKVKVRLDVKVLAADAATAQAHLLEIDESLAESPWLQDRPRTDRISYSGVKSVFVDLAWIPESSATKPEGAAGHAGRIEVELDPNELERELASGAQEDLNASLYIRSIAAENTVGLGDVAIGERERASVAGAGDRIYEVRGKERESGTERIRIGNFLYLLERNSDLARVTFVQLKPVGIDQDLWDFEIELTVRELDP